MCARTEQIDLSNLPAGLLEELAAAPAVRVRELARVRQRLGTVSLAGPEVVEQIVDAMLADRRDVATA